MAEQAHKRPSKYEEPESEDVPSADASELIDETDDLLADIDDVLEENAQDFVASFIQKGGE